jgi:solute:Na+ symporter, SSS family
VGMIAGTVMVSQLGFRSSTYPLDVFGLTFPTYAALLALALNIALAVVVTLAPGQKNKTDETAPADYVLSNLDA